MPTVRQRKLAKKIVETLDSDENPTLGSLVESVGYDETTAKSKPGEIIDSVGVQEALKDLGFTIESADQVVKDILFKGKKEESKLKAADLMYKRLGGYAPDRSISLNLNKTEEVSNIDLDEITTKVAEELKKQKSGWATTWTDNHVSK